MTEIKRVVLLMLCRKLPTDSVHEIYNRPICEALDPYSAIPTGAGSLDNSQQINLHILMPRGLFAGKII
jgi:hypothetical protein